jgi:hypothetical protein
MPVPAIGNVVTPSGFSVLSAQAQVQLNWNYAPLATIYYVSRSADGVTFDELGSTTALFYNDTTGDVGTVYYYYVQAGNGSASSQPTPTLQALSLNPGQTTVGNIRLECQQRINKENSQFYTTQEWNSMISQSYKELWDILAQKFGDDYFVAEPYTYQTANGTQFYPLPSDFKALLGVEVSLNSNDPNAWISLRQFEFAQRNLWNYPNVYTFYGITNLRYRVNGNNLMIVPAQQGGQTIRIWYVPRPNQLINDTDTVDAVAGWEEYIVADACIKALAKEESDVSVFAAQKLALLQRIEEAAENRNIGEPQKVTDIKRINFAWGDGNGSGYGFGGDGW